MFSLRISQFDFCQSQVIQSGATGGSASLWNRPSRYGCYAKLAEDKILIFLSLPMDAEVWVTKAIATPKERLIASSIAVRPWDWQRAFGLL